MSSDGLMGSGAAAVPAGGAPGRKALFDLRRSPVLRAVGTLGWPILQKEIRTDFRKNRFFVTHLVCLLALAIGILWKVVVDADNTLVKPEDIGKELFNNFFIIQLLVVAVVFPAFSATAISEERSAVTFDLLITTSLRPAEVIWGKFLACSVYCLVYIIATVPLLAVSYLFAGVSFPEILVAYLFLIGLTVLLTMAGIFISSCFSSNIMSTFTVYTVSFGLLAYMALSLWSIFDEKEKGTLVRAALKKVFALKDVSMDLATLLPRVAWVAWLFLLAFAYLFLLAANRIRPRTDDRSSKLRALTFIAIAVALAAASVAGGALRDGDVQSIIVWTSAALFLVCLVFPAEGADLPDRLRRRYAGWRGTAAPLRIFAQGSFSGLVYATVLTGVALAFLGLLAARVPGSPGAGGFHYGEALATLPLYLFAFAALGFFLSVSGFTPAYTRLTVVFVFIISLLLPVIFDISGHRDGVFSLYYLSPITLWNSLDGQPRPDGPTYLVLGIPAVRIAQALFAGLGIVFTALGVRRSLRLGYPLLSYGSRPAGAGGVRKPPAARRRPRLAGAGHPPAGGSAGAAR
jgi:ABC-type transport system involved in multi-copper enzyme maturation permease subunit